MFFVEIKARSSNRLFSDTGIFELETLVARAMTSTLITLPQMGNGGVDY